MKGDAGGIREIGSRHPDGVLILDGDKEAIIVAMRQLEGLRKPELIVIHKPTDADVEWEKELREICEDISGKTFTPMSTISAEFLKAATADLIARLEDEPKPTPTQTHNDFLQKLSRKKRGRRR